MTAETCQFSYDDSPYSGDIYRYDSVEGDDVFCHQCLGDHLVNEALFWGDAIPIDEDIDSE